MGSALAYELAKRKISVTLVDRSLPGRASSASAGGLWPIGEAVGLGCGVILHASKGNSEEGPDILPEVFREFLRQSNGMFADLAIELKEVSGADFEYQPGPGLIYAVLEEKERTYVHRILESLGEGAPVQWLDPDELRKVEPLLTDNLVGLSLIHI